MVWKRTQASEDSEDQPNEEEESAELVSENTELVDAMQTNHVFEDGMNVWLFFITLTACVSIV